MSETPSVPAVLFIVFKRPETTRRVFESIRAAQPPVLYIAADGPRVSRVGEADLCATVRQIAQAVNWPCRVELKLREQNVGIKTNVSQAITWFLDAEGEGIILEDDCCPSPEFFHFAATMLKTYRTDTRIYHISGSCFQPKKRGKASYFFSRYNHGWGWATWKRAWDRCDLSMETVDAFLHEAKRTLFWHSKQERRYWTKIFHEQKAGHIDTWDYQWKYTLWRDGALAIYPNANMVSNLGFSNEGTNTVAHDSEKADRGWETPVRGGISNAEWIHPEAMLRDVVADEWTFFNLYWGQPIQRMQSRARTLFSLMYSHTRR